MPLYGFCYCHARRPLRKEGEKPDASVDFFPLTGQAA